MRRFSVFVVALTLAASLATAGAEAPPPFPQGQAAAALSAADEVERVERELVEAIGKGDMATYDRIVADDYVAHTATGQESTKAEVMASYRSGARRYISLQIKDVKVRVFGETAVLAASTLGDRAEEGQQPVPNRVRYFRVFALREGRWRAVMQIVAAPPDTESQSREPGAPTPWPSIASRR